MSKVSEQPKNNYGVGSSIAECSGILGFTACPCLSRTDRSSKFLSCAVIFVYYLLNFELAMAMVCLISKITIRAEYLMIDKISLYEFSNTEKAEHSSVNLHLYQSTCNINIQI